MSSLRYQYSNLSSTCKLWFLSVQKFIHEIFQSVEVGCLRSVAPDLHNEILGNLHKLSFTSMSGELHDVEGTRHHFTKGGRLVASKQIVYTIVQETGLEPVNTKFSVFCFLKQCCTVLCIMTTFQILEFQRRFFEDFW